MFHLIANGRSVFLGCEGGKRMSVGSPEIYQLDQFVARRKVFKLFGAGFTLLTPDGRVLAASHQKAFRLKEEIRVHEGSDDGPELLTIKANKVLDFSAAYQVIDSSSGELIGSLQRKGWTSMFRDSWEILDADGVVRGRVTEDSGWKAMARRLNEWIALLLPQAFQIEVGGQVVGTMRQNFNVFVQRYDVDLRADADGLLPRPLAVATVILLLAIEGRQS